MAELINEKPADVLSVNKWKFITWIFIITIIMLFASQTSAYLVRRAEGNWTEFTIPTIFYWSTLVLIISSAFLQIGYHFAKKDELGKVKIFIVLAFIFGITFLVMQYYGWLELQKTGIFLKGNPSGSFLYVLTGLHCFHLVTGLVVLLFTLKGAIKSQIHSQNLIQMEVSLTYWHFLDLLWVYLFVFLLYFR